MALDGIFDRASEFLSNFETEKIRDMIMNLDERGFMILGGSTAALVILCLLKKMTRTATLVIALCAITVLLHYTIPEEGEALRLNQLVALFVGGSFIVGAAIYFIFIRSD
jgi:hypothetical protein